LITLLHSLHSQTRFFFH